MGFLKRLFGGKPSHDAPEASTPPPPPEPEQSPAGEPESPQPEQPPHVGASDTAPQPSFSGPWRARPIFVSSTFRDVHAERDHLANVVFPELEERLRARRQTLEPIDLRLGVETSTVAEQRARELLVLKVCLDEIERSRPFLLVLLGDRYGWVPSEDRIAAAAQEAGFEPSDLQQSVTALEIEYGILKKDPEQRRRSLFFFRDPFPYDEMSQEDAAAYCDAHSSDSAARDGYAKLEALKAKISADPELAGHVHRYRLDWDPARRGPTAESLEAWGKTVLEALWAELDGETKENERSAPTNADEMEQAALEEFVQHKLRNFMGRGELLAHLTALALSPVEEGSDWGACVKGGPGSGKSAIFAALYRRLTEEAPDNTLVLAHAIGSTPRAARLGDMLLRFIRQLAAALGRTPSVTEQSKPDEIEQAFRILMRQVAEQRRVVLLLDALDQFESDFWTTGMAWIKPTWWPENARVITTSQPGKEATALEQWAGIGEIDVPALGETEATDISNAIWARYHRTCNPTVLASVLAVTREDGDSAYASPLWLSLAMEQLNLLDADDFNRAGQDITFLLLEKARALPADTEGMYNLMFDRAEKLFGPGWTRSFLCLTALGRAGWREMDYQGALQPASAILAPEADAPEWDGLRFAALRRSFRSQLVQRDEYGRWDFTHAQMRQAVQRRYLDGAETVRRLHDAIATHLLALPEDDPLGCEGAMWHLIHADDKQRAAARFGMERRVFSGLISLADYIISTGRVQPNPGVEWALALLNLRLWDYKSSLQFVSEANGILWLLLCEHQVPLEGKVQWLSGIQSFLEEGREAMAGNPNWLHELAVSHLHLSDVIESKGDLDGVEQHRRAALTIYEHLAVMDPSNPGWQRNFALSHVKLYSVLGLRGDIDGSEKHLRLALDISEHLAELDSDNTGWLRAAEVSIKKSDRWLGSDNGEWQRELADRHSDFSLLLLSKGDLDGAERHLGSALKIHQYFLNLEVSNGVLWNVSHLEVRSNLSTFCKIKGDLDGAEAHRRYVLGCHEKIVEINPRSGEQQFSLAHNHSLLGDVLEAKGDLDGAKKHQRVALNIYRHLVVLDPDNTWWQQGLVQEHSALGRLLLHEDEFDEAEWHLRTALDIRERFTARDSGTAAWQHDLATNHYELGYVLEKMGDSDGAEQHQRTALNILECLSAQDPGKAELQEALGDTHYALGIIHQAKGNLAGAEQHLCAALGILECLSVQDPDKAEWQHDLATSHLKLGDVLKEMGESNGAEQHLRAALDILECLSVQDPDNAKWQHVRISTNFTLGNVQQAKGNLSGAEQHLRAALDIQNELFEKVPPDARDLQWRGFVHFKLAWVLEAKGDHLGMQEQHRLCKEINDRLPKSNIVEE